MVASLLLLMGCATVQLPESSGSFPVLIYQVPLPGYDRITNLTDLRIELKLHIAKDSTVQEVIFLSSNTDPRWEASAIEEIRKWRFLPAMQNGVAVPVWIRQSILIRPSKPVQMSLSEIASPNRNESDSIYSLLMMGQNFDSLARSVSIAPTRAQNGRLGNVNIRSYPYHIQRELEKLTIGDITPPLLLGRSYLIFKRIKSEEELKGD